MGSSLHDISSNCVDACAAAHAHGVTIDQRIQEKDCKRCNQERQQQIWNIASYITKWCQDYQVVYLNLFRSSHQRSSTGVCKKTEKVFLEISHKIHKENTCVRVSFLRFIKTEILPQLFSCEFCEISKNTFFTEHLLKFWRLLLLLDWSFSLTFLSPLRS